VWTNICLDTYVSSTTFLLERISKSRKKSRCCKDLCASSVRHRTRQANRGTTAVVVGLKEVIDTGHAAIRGGVNIPALTWWCGCQRRRQCRRLSPWRPHARRWGQGLEERREASASPSRNVPHRPQHLLRPIRLHTPPPGSVRSALSREGARTTT
jgi:hypothetical protein